MTPRLPLWTGTLLRGAPFAALVAAVALYDHRYHEFWRDEACALLEASAVPWSGLLHAMRIEGIPPLYHVLLKLLTLTLPNPAALLVAGMIGFGTLLFGTYRLVDAIASCRKAAVLVTLTLSLTYTYSYELGVMIRQYALGLGLSLLAISHFRRALDRMDGRSIRRGTLAAAAGALVSAHSACVAGAALLAFGVTCLARRRPIRAFWPIFLTLPCFALVVYLGLPFSERTPEANEGVVRSTPAALHVAGQLLVEGLMPNDWWRAESFVPPRFALLFAALRSVGFWGALTGLALATLARAGSPGKKDGADIRPRGALGFEILAATAGCVPLLSIMVYRYWGAYRHQLFLAVPAVITAAAWMFGAPAPGRLARIARIAAAIAMIPWLALQVWMAALDLAADYWHPFSDTKAAAAVLPPGARVIGREEWQSAAIVFWRPDIHYRSPAGRGRPYRYTSPDRDWHRVAAVPYLVADECAATHHNVYLAGPRASLGVYAGCAAPVPFPGMRFGDHPFTWETFNLHEIDCACVSDRAASPDDAPLPPP